ncbi:hypothetical protein BHE90_015328 [Fusarium euwallaceae]|uniref:Uncharacterized protein n=1 Tax=Fusarium euwallaceae TaxID=1147111 RepID=A0A430L3E7_9HYPO|nr:hypothetical protein BHE90_015328 [Fusarium euwallaceae]
MSPPPSTPTPRRFLLAKRGGAATQSSQTPTGPPRFQSTPRFGSSSVPRPTQSRAIVDIEDVEEVEEDLVEESSSNSDDQGLVTRKHVPLNDSIEVEDDDDDDVTASRDGSVGISISEDDEEEEEDIPRKSMERESPGLLNLPHDTSPLEEREPKRRRVSISPMPEPSPLGEHHYLNGENLQEAEDREQTPTQSSVESLQDAIPTHDEARAPQQPTFRPPPRFKPAEVDPTVEGLPAAFSPQRRGAKYVAGGLAAGLQGWLSEVKGWEGTVPSAAAAVSVVKVVVEEVRPGRRMYLVTGRDGAASARRFLLAGEGRLTGLGQRAAVTVGNVVEVGQPVWDVELDGQVWTVACDWGVS